MTLSTPIKAILITILMVNSWNTYGLGISEWQHDTPGGNVIGNAQGNHIELALFRKEIDVDSNGFYIKQWYFYENYIIGLSENGYFMVNESLKDIILFSTELEWKNAIYQKHLKPSVWTRWYSDNWVSMDGLAILFLLLGIPLMILMIPLLYKAIKYENFKLTNWNIVFLLGLLLFLGLTTLLDAFPQSF